MSVDGSRRAAVVTGGATGIGYACSRRLLERGLDVLLCGRREHVIEEAVRELGRAGSPVVVHGVAADMAAPADPERVVRTCVERYGRIDVLVNNAGIYSELPFLELTLEAWEETMNTNLRGAVLASVAAARQMRKQGSGGRIVHLSSISAAIVEPGFTHYQCSKAGLSSLAQAMALELAPYGIRTNAVAPGWIRTPMTETYLEGVDSATLARVNPLARAGTADEVANVVAYLCTDAPDFLNGETIFVDGGQMSMAAVP